MQHIILYYTPIEYLILLMWYLFYRSIITSKIYLFAVFSQYRTWNHSRVSKSSKSSLKVSIHIILPCSKVPRPLQAFPLYLQKGTYRPVFLPLARIYTLYGTIIAQKSLNQSLTWNMKTVWLDKKKWATLNQGLPRHFTLKFRKTALKLSRRWSTNYNMCNFRVPNNKFSSNLMSKRQLFQNKTIRSATIRPPWWQKSPQKSNLLT